MGEQQMAKLAEHAKRNPEFLAEFRQDPVGATRAAGFEVEDNEAAAMQRLDFAQLTDEHLISVLDTFFMYY
jgi:argininosuccinate lyase